MCLTGTVSGTKIIMSLDITDDIAKRDLKAKSELPAIL
jgi:hypothetical protein